MFFNSLLLLVQGDLWYFLWPVTRSVQADLLCIFIAFYMSCVTRQVSERTVLTQREDGSYHPKHHAVRTLIVKDLTSIFEKAGESENCDIEEAWTSTWSNGFLKERNRHETYGFVLYADEFQQKSSMKDKKNICSVYLLLFCSDKYIRYYLARVRAQKRALFGQDSKKALKIYIDYIVQVVLDGFPTVNAYRNKCKVFLNTVAASVTLQISSRHRHPC